MRRRCHAQEVRLARALPRAQQDACCLRSRDSRQCTEAEVASSAQKQQQHAVHRSRGSKQHPEAAAAACSAQPGTRLQHLDGAQHVLGGGVQLGSDELQVGQGGGSGRQCKLELGSGREYDHELPAMTMAVSVEPRVPCMGTVYSTLVRSALGGWWALTRPPMQPPISDAHVPLRTCLQ